MTTKIRWGAEKRQEFIEFRVFWEGGVNRSDLTEQFGISVPQASADLSAYQALAPGNLVYDSSLKRYIAAKHFEPRRIILSAEDYLSQLRMNAETSELELDTWIRALPPVDAMPIPTRSVKPYVLRSILVAIEGSSSIEIQYQSMNPKNPDLAWRRITPHAFCTDGTRWHVRAFCHSDSNFKDFLLSRCQDTRELGPAGGNPSDDVDWFEKLEVVLEPNPALSASQQKGIALDYAMTDGRLVLSIRRALLFYLNKHLRLDMIKYDPTPGNNPLVVANRAEFDQAIQRASF